MEFTPQEYRIIAHALLAVSKSGGGSSQYHLARKVMEHQEIEPSVDLVLHYQRIAAKELEEDAKVTIEEIDALVAEPVENKWDFGRDHY